MDLATVLGLGIAVVGIIGGNIVEGGNPMKLINIPGFMIVVLGTLGATMVSQPLAIMIGLPKAIMKAFFGPKEHDPAAIVDLLVSMADRARREGLLALEGEIEKIHDPFLRKGTQLMIDGTDPELLRQIMEIEAEAMKHRHHGHYHALEFMGGIAPTIGVLGAVMGLMSVMQHLDEPDHIGPGIATAFVATFYGVFTANVLYLPLAKKLEVVSKHEQEMLNLIIEGLMSIQAGDNPRIVREKLEGFLSPVQRKSGKEHEPAAAAAREAA
ncbi:MAG: flagellar motor protein [Chloroflexota bacterium]|nr:flagellar motor protein [Dehalococcoidia bacterium]MDW8047617.1 flagellar motor protein [Chloroflexota bacterium]